MKRILSILLALVMVFTLVFSSVGTAFAANASLSVSGSGSYTKGSTVTVTYKYSGSSIGGGTSNVTYNSSVLQYVSCSGGIAPGSASGVFAVQFGDGNDHTSITITLTFKAIGTGSGNVSIKTTDLIDYEGNPLNFPSGSASITVTNPAPNVSSNANLSSLYVSTGNLSPAFSAGRTSYTVNVGENQTVCLISAEAQDSGATIKVTGSKNLIVGKNIRTVVVTAPSGNTKTYTITIIRAGNTSSGEEETEDPNEEVVEELKTTIGEDTYIIQENIKPEDVPENFRLMVGKFEGKDIPLIKDNDLNYTLVLLKNEKTGDMKWFFYNEEAGTFSETQSVTSDEVFEFVKLSNTDIEEEKHPLSDNMIILLLLLGGTLAILIIVVIVLQCKIVSNKKKKLAKKAIKPVEQPVEEVEKNLVEGEIDDNNSDI